MDKTNDTLLHTNMTSNFVKFGLQRVCCHCGKSENDMYEVKYSITRRTDGKTVHRKKNLPLIMTELPDVLCLEIRNSYSFICNLCLDENNRLVRKFNKVDVTADDLFEGIQKAQEGIVRLVLKHLNQNEIDSKYGDSLDSALHICCQNCYLACGKALVEHGATVDVLNRRGETPLYQASLRPNRHEMVELLLLHGADPRKHTNAGSTPLHAATVAGEHKYVIELVKNGAIVNTQNTQNGETPLHKACSLAEPETVRELLLARAHKSIRNHAGQRPYELAFKRRYTHHRYEECVKLMETKNVSEIKDILLTTDDSPEEIQKEKNITELIEKLEEMDKLFEEIEWVEMKKKGKIVWFSMELDMLLTKNPKEIIQEIDHDLINPKIESNESDTNGDDEVENKTMEEDEDLYEILFDSHGYKYWRDKMTLECTYEDPGKKPPAPWVRHDLNTANGNDPWIQCYDEYNENTYWYNQETGETYYDDNHPDVYINDSWQAARQAVGKTNGENIQQDGQDQQDNYSVYNENYKKSDNHHYDDDYSKSFALTEENLKEYEQGYNNNNSEENVVKQDYEEKEKSRNDT